MTEQELRAERQQTLAAQQVADASVASADTQGLSLGVVIAWSAVGIPLAWGTWITVTKALPLFG
jgi:tetrahydromethanopterin S-methyltransferase subunit F